MHSRNGLCVILVAQKKSLDDDDVNHGGTDLDGSGAMLVSNLTINELATMIIGRIQARKEHDREAKITQRKNKGIL